MMAGVSYFQRYSQKENHLTNNVLLMLRRLYEYSPAKLEQVLGEILGDQGRISIGPSFAQQQREGNNIPDAVIRQEPIRLYIETKRGEMLDESQLRGHCDGIARRAGDQSTIILLGLTTRVMDREKAQTIEQYAKDRGIIFKSVTFAQIVSALSDVVKGYEVGLTAVREDFEAYLRTERVLEDPFARMLVAPCGISHAENAQFGIYYDGAWRPTRAKVRFFGAYWDKAVRLIGEIEAVLVCRYDAGKAVVETAERGAADTEMLSRIAQIIEASSYYPELKTTSHRYFVMKDGFHQTNWKKASKGPIRGAQYLSLGDVLPAANLQAIGAPELAAALDQRSFDDRADQ